MSNVILSDFQLQAMRANKVEYSLLKRRINIMNNNLQHNLGVLQREAQDLKHHYHNVVRIVKSSRPHALWENPYAYETESSETKNTLESLKLQSLLTTKSGEQKQCLSDESSSESFLPLLVSVKAPAEKPIADKSIGFSEIFQQKPSQSIQPDLNHRHDISKLKLIDEYSTKSTKTTNTRSWIRDTSNTTKKLPNPNSTRQRAKFENQSSNKSIERIRMEACRSFDNSLGTKYQTLQRTMRLAGVIK